MKKITLFTISIVIIFLLSINIYVLVSRDSIQSSVENLDLLKSRITSLDTIKTNIVHLAHMQKSYLLTGDESFKVQYNDYLDSSNAMLENFVTDNIITHVDKEELTTILKNYDSINNILLDSKPTLPLSKELEDLLLESNNIQVELLNKISLAIANHSDITKNSSNTITNSINNQKNFIQIISSFFTLLISGPVYYISKKYNGGNFKLDSFFSSINFDEKKQNSCSNMIAYVSLLSKHNLSMKKQWKEVDELIITLQQSISKLRIDLDTTDNANYSIINSELHDIELQIISLKMFVKQLPNYHEIIVHLSDSIISIEK